MTYTVTAFFIIKILVMKQKKIIAAIAASLAVAAFCGYKYRRAILDTISDLKEEFKFYLDMTNEEV